MSGPVDSLKKLSLEKFQQLVSRGTILEEDGHGIKVLQLPDGTIVKAFRLKHIFSSALISPYAHRFVKNARRLNELGVLTVQVRDIFYFCEHKRYLVFYDPLPGEVLRSVLAKNRESLELLYGLAAFLARLHDLGVCFRSIHFGNIIVLPSSDKLGLIDVADMAIKKRPLSMAARVRNFVHMLRYEEDCRYVEAFGADQLLQVYLSKAQLTPDQESKLKSQLEEKLSLFKA